MSGTLFTTDITSEISGLQVHTRRGIGARPINSDSYSKSDKRSRSKALSHTLSTKHNNRLILFSFIPKPQEVFWRPPRHRLLNECALFLLQINDCTCGQSNQIFRSIRSVYPHTSLLLSFYYFLSESHSSHFISLPCSANGKQKVK